MKVQGFVAGETTGPIYSVTAFLMASVTFASVMKVGMMVSLGELKCHGRKRRQKGLCMENRYRVTMDVRSTEHSVRDD